MMLNIPICARCRDSANLSSACVGDNHEKDNDDHDHETCIDDNDRDDDHDKHKNCNYHSDYILPFLISGLQEESQEYQGAKCDHQLQAKSTPILANMKI